MPEELLCHPVVEIGHGHPLAGGTPAASGTKGMDMGMESCGLAERLDDRDHAGSEGFFLESGGAHELSYRLVRATGELGEKLTMVEKVDPEHLGDGETHMT